MFATPIDCSCGMSMRFRLLIELNIYPKSTESDLPSNRKFGKLMFVTDVQPLKSAPWFSSVRLLD